MATIITVIIGFVLMNVGFWAANADKDPDYRKRILPNYDTFIHSARALQAGTKVTQSDALFWIYDAFLKSQDASLQQETIDEISKLNCNGASIMSTGKIQSECTFDIILDSGESKQVRVEDLQEKIDYGLLHGPAYLMEKRTFNLGVLLQLLSGILWLFNRASPSVKKKRKSSSKK